jgi:hypothetical protein
MTESLSEKAKGGTFRARLSDAEKKELVRRFWPHEPHEPHDPHDPQFSVPYGYRKYFEYYEGICASIYKVGCVPPNMMVADTHEHVFRIVDAIYEILRGTVPCTRPEVRRLLQTQTYLGSQPAEKLNHSINLTLRLWLLMNIQEPDFSRGEFASWDDDSTLRNLIERQFPGPRGELNLARGAKLGIDKERSTVLESNFTAANLQRIAGIEIKWTDNLLEHLHFNKRKRQLCIFPLKLYLYNQQHV